MSYDVLKLCKKLEDGTYEIDPGIFFPATLKRIQECIKGADPIEIVSAGWQGRPDREPVADRFLREAEAFPPAAWNVALTPFSEIEPGSVAQKLRAEVLGFIESWFKRALALQVGRGVKLHITRNPDWKR